MPYPWPSFGSFRFAKDERVVFDTDNGWLRQPSISEQRPLGSATSSIVTLAIGSARRTFECRLTPARFAALEALVNTTALFTDWDRPTPDSRQAFLRSVTPLDRSEVLVCRNDGSTPNTVRVRVELISQ